MAAPIPSMIQLPSEERRGKYERVLGVHKFAPDEHRRRRIAASRLYRKEHPERYRQIKRQYTAECRVRINAMKANPCADCGGRFPAECMDFDHVRGEKRDGVSRMIDYSPALLEAELAKCELVCANCHRIRTKIRRNTQ